MKNYRKLLGILTRKIHSLKNIISSLKEKLANFDMQNVHFMEVQHNNKIVTAEVRQYRMNDEDLRVDLEKQYGTTKWAKKLINEMLIKRIIRRDAAVAA
jgi:hypothetical protein